MEAGRSEVQRHPWLHIEFKVSLGTQDPISKTKQTNRILWVLFLWDLGANLLVSCAVFLEVQSGFYSLSPYLRKYNAFYFFSPCEVVLNDRVKNFYSRLPFQKLTGISIRDKIPMSGKSISNGFFECERLCDRDACCTGFGFLNVSQLQGGEVTCLTLNSMGIQTCNEENGGTWRILDCGSEDTEVYTYPFGWYQKPGE